MKKIIAVLTVLSIVFAFSACSSKKYKETEATVPVTNEQGETVTNSNGEVLTEVVTTDGETTVVSSNQNDTSSTSTAAGASTKTSTTKKASKKTDKSSSASKVETTKKGSSSSSVKTTKKADKSSGEQTSKGAQPATDGKTQNNAASVSASQSATKKNDTTETTKKAETSSTTKKEDSASTTKKDTTTATTKPTTTKPTTTEKPKKRDIKVKVVLPFYNDEQATVKISYKLEGKEKFKPVMFADPENPKKEIDTKAVKLDGKSTVDCTIENVKGDVEIKVQLKDFSGKDNIKNNTVTVKSNETEVTISPLTGIGMVNGDDESFD